MKRITKIEAADTGAVRKLRILQGDSQNNSSGNA